MELFKSLSSDHMYVRFSLPADDAMVYLFPEWSMGAAAWKNRDAGMVRVVNVAAVLQKARCRGTGRAVLKIADPQIPENNASFAVAYRDGQAVRVEKTEETPDAELPINVFSALISGVCSLDAAVQWMPGVKIFGQKEALEGIFFQKPLLICDYF